MFFFSLLTISKNAKKIFFAGQNGDARYISIHSKPFQFFSLDLLGM